MKHLRNQSGMIDIVLILVVFIAAAALGGYVYYQQRQSQQADKAAGNGVTVASHPKAKTTPMVPAVPIPSKNGITIMAPTDGSTVKTTFILAGAAPVGEDVTITVDGTNLYYVDPKFRAKQTGQDQDDVADSTGHYSIPIDLTGTNVVEDRSASNYLKRSSLGLGKHTFYVTSGLNSSFIEGPTISLTIQ